MEHGCQSSDARHGGKIVASSPSVVHPIEVVVRDAANARVNKVAVLPDVTAEEVLWRAISMWKLPEHFEYVVRVVRQGRQVTLTQTMSSLGIAPGDVLEVQALASAGSRSVSATTQAGPDAI